MALPRPITTEADVHAVRDVIAGRASPEQQTRAMRWIGEQACRIFDSPYVADGAERETFIAIGRHQVGVMIAAMNSTDTLEAARAADLERASPRQPSTTTRNRRGKP